MSWKPMSYEDQRATVLEFKKRFPRYQGLDIRTQRKVLDGELVIVNKGSRKFVLMTKDEVAPGGKLDKINAATRKANALIRAKNKAARMEAARVMAAIVRGDCEPLADFLEGKSNKEEVK